MELTELVGVAVERVRLDKTHHLMIVEVMVVMEFLLQLQVLRYLEQVEAVEVLMMIPLI